MRERHGNRHWSRGDFDFIVEEKNISDLLFEEYILSLKKLSPWKKESEFWRLINYANPPIEHHIYIVNLCKPSPMNTDPQLKPLVVRYFVCGALTYTEVLELDFGPFLYV